LGALKWPGDHIEIAQGEDAVRFTSGDSTRTYRPAIQPCITVETPLHEHVGARCGWDRGSWVVIVKSKRGPKITETYTVVDEGDRLLQRIHVQGGRMDDLELSRTFDRTPPAARAPSPDSPTTPAAPPTH
jgi:hypothetical protein